MITVSTDGSCLRNPGGAIGWAWVDHAGGAASGGLTSGTNQVAELMALLEAIESHPGAEPLHIESDSQYAIKCASVWVAGWRRKGWRTAGGGPVQNLALVQGIDRAIAGRDGPVTFGWVRGHVGNHFNELADQLAGAAAREAQAGRPSVTRQPAPPETGRSARPAAPGLPGTTPGTTPDDVLDDVPGTVPDGAPDGVRRTAPPAGTPVVDVLF
ncbi:ribonuclease H [uncultured Cellulomonas sp.]|uniref:ribonuclease H family protein n=1 Tax=uncultured Cellulomonas sp. TaxID=189682 RepID=UPI00261C274F|nr:ribonuclease H [uncultured Cellulomonas sp.]